MTPVVIGLAGGTGSGKTTIAQHIVERVGQGRIAYLAQDAYYRNWADLPKVDGNQVNWDHPDSLDNRLLVAHIRALKAGQPVEIPTYDFTQHRRAKLTRHIEPQPLILVEGILIFAEPEVREQFDMKIYVDTDADLRFIRRLQRDITERDRSVQSVIQQYLTTVRVMHLEFVEPSKRYADIIVPEGGNNTVALDMIVARLVSLLDTTQAA